MRLQLRPHDTVVLHLQAMDRCEQVSSSAGERGLCFSWPAVIAVEFMSEMVAFVMVRTCERNLIGLL